MEEQGIPGHASGWEPMRMLQMELKRLGVSFEAEGDDVRIHLEEVIIEAKEDPMHSLIVQVQAPLPVPGGENAGRSIMVAASLIEGLTGTAYYEVEELAPGYPVLRAIIPYKDPYRLASDLLESIRSLISVSETNDINRKRG